MTKPMLSNLARKVDELSEEMAKFGGVYELIDEVICDGTFARIALDTEPNGKAYKFERMLCVVDYPITDEDFQTGAIAMVFYAEKEDDNFPRVYATYSTSYTIKPTDKYNFVVTALVEIDGGVVQGRNNVSLSNSLEHQQRNNGPIARYVGNEKIGRVAFEPANILPEGTTMRVYGVRANA